MGAGGGDGGWGSLWGGLGGTLSLFALGVGHLPRTPLETEHRCYPQQRYVVTLGRLLRLFHTPVNTKTKVRGIHLHLLVRPSVVTNYIPEDSDCFLATIYHVLTFSMSRSSTVPHLLLRHHPVPSCTKSRSPTM